MTAENLAVVVNTRDADSIVIAQYYVAARGIPAENVIRVSIPNDMDTLPAEVFSRMYDEVRRATPSTVQAYALTWSRPFRAGCMSITTAFATGFRNIYCAQGCQSTAPSPLYDSDTLAPYDDVHWRPTMMLAGQSVAAVTALIDRGVAADNSRPSPHAYLLVTSDKARSTRATAFAQTQVKLQGHMDVEVLAQDELRDRTDVMFYFTGGRFISGLETLRFPPGALADHLTSTGGVLFGTSQMSILRWLEAGATASYGTVVEPCNFPQKFPHPEVVIRRYLAGETALEAYWKSVAWPGQGLFVGEPLSRPYGAAVGAAAALSPRRRMK
ncbi:MAG: TIGR03790 family protein [Gammaproteobacteria bacterium]|nr:TIGR03790 family protein [Gammaproteobacteria bacterium]